MQLWRDAENQLDTQQHDVARATYQRLLEDPQFAAPARLRLSLIASAQRRYRESIDEALAAFQVRQPDPELLAMIAKRLFSLGEAQAARTCAIDSAVLRTPHIPTLAELGKLLSDASLPGDALQLLERARTAGLNSPMLRYLIGLCRMYTGDAAAAETELESCLQADPAMAPALLTLAKLRRRPAGGNERVERLQAAIAHRGEEHADAALLQYALFIELDARDEIQPAWEALAEGMRLRRRQVRYDAVAEQALFDHLGALRPRPVESRISNGPQPVFIVGMPRSGTTLLERILGGHPDVTDAGELRDLTRQLRWCCDLAGGSFLDLKLAQRAEDTDWAELGRRYLAHTQWRAQGRAVYTDKMPANFMNVSYIARALPQARILHMVRGPMDTCFSNLKECFANGYAHSYDQIEMADHYRHYRALMARWRAQFPGRILDVRYADLVTDPESVMREVLEFCDLPQHEGMTAIENRSGTVATASAAQVREPIHQRFLEQWRRYEPHLTPLRERLGALAY